MSFENYLAECDIDIEDLPSTVVVEVGEDDSTDMAYVAINGIVVIECGFNDFYEGCYVHPPIGEYNDLEEFVELIENHLGDVGIQVDVVRVDYEYED